MGLFRSLLELQDPAGGEWRVAGELHDQPVTDGLLGTWNTAGLPAGAYQLRLVVVNRTGHLAPPYVLSVYVVQP